MKGLGSFLIRYLFLPAVLVCAAWPAAARDASAARALHCLALNIYFEARGEPLEGKIAVGHVVLNRAADPRFPHNICAVIKQGGWKHRNRCNFSWWCDGRSDRPRNARAWHECLLVAELIQDGLTLDPTDGALWYHAENVDPAWAHTLVERVKIGAHVFYAAHNEAQPGAGTQS